ncbi:FUSC family protein [Actinomycetospora chlora]|uniref:FUSC family protein n=1 Tax=Actinomycetospora chlora TaxID=663608 RepID=A0ABP9ADR9_9PSEU
MDDRRAAAWRAWARDLVRLRGTGFDAVDVVRAGVCAGAPVLVGWWAGDVTAGLTASIGAFVALYGAGRPYRSRARVLGVLALGIPAVVVAGALSAVSPVLTVVTVAAIAVLATWRCQAADTGPPGPYMVVLAAATASGIPHADTEAWRLGLLVLAGAVFSWLVHLAGALAGFRRPEEATVAAGGEAVAGLVAAVGTDRYPVARDRAARAMHRCWVVLAEQQGTPRRGGTLERLRALAFALHGELAAAVRAQDEGRPVDPDATRRVRTLAGAVADPPPVPHRVGPDDVPLGGPGVRRTARALLVPGSPWRAVLVRVGVAAVLAGTLGVVVGLEHAYWAVAAAVLVLCQGLGWSGTLERAVLRLAGTLLGLLVAAAMFAAAPTGVALALTIAVLQSLAQWLLPRNYGVGVVAVTPLALAIGTGAHTPDPGALLLARGLDTAVGCAIGVLVFLAVRPRAALPDPRALVAATLREAARVVPFLAAGRTATPEARGARRDLTTRLLAVADAHDVGELAAPLGPHPHTTAWWPALDAAHRLGQQVLAACWALDTGVAEPVPAPGLAAELEALAGWVGDGTGPPPDGHDTGEGVLGLELAALRASLPAAAVW